MEQIYSGKTKDVFLLDDGNYLLKFKDDVTGENGVFDPGSNSIGLTIEGIGNKGLRLTTLFFEYLNENGIKTHFIESDFENTTMKVKPASVFGKGLEVICRSKATGSFMRRYGEYATEGMDLNHFVEITLKDDDRLDPPINKEALNVLNILSNDEYEVLVKQTKDLTKLVEKKLAEFDIVLYDIKFEFGRDKKTNEIILIDEISGGNMRAYKDNEILEPMTLGDIVLGLI
ncbi:phosphoribosylaminoimidazole-succinocarboxamide synthase [Bacilli bacterium PM5-3]|nr:phosphoribosylaminoimidazole-succinocarboxamide synthase [Bacilli bacterium PM5-3]MDH6603589.1 phosphoribosylaminoimidazole-succinocarboxamide synthase [Bacilli bacterium PM5-9]